MLKVVPVTLELKEIKINISVDNKQPRMNHAAGLNTPYFKVSWLPNREDVWSLQQN